MVWWAELDAGGVKDLVGDLTGDGDVAGGDDLAVSPISTIVFRNIPTIGQPVQLSKSRDRTRSFPKLSFEAQ